MLGSQPSINKGVSATTVTHDGRQRLLVEADIPVADRILQAAHKVDFSFASLLRGNCASAS